MPLDGNVLNPNFAGGADPTGGSDSRDAFQACADSNFAMFVPPGIYRIDSSVTFDQPKLIECFGGSMATGYTNQDGMNSPILQDQQVRFYTNNNIHMWVINQEQVFFRGGCHDFQGVTAHDKAAFHVRVGMSAELFPNRRTGWGGGIDATVLGNFIELREGNTSYGTKGIFIDMETGISGGQLYRTRYNVRALGCDKAIHVSPFGAGLGQSVGSQHFEVDAKDCRYSMYMEATSNNWVQINHVAGPIFPTQTAADNTASVYCPSNGGLFYGRFPDFDAGQDGSYWNNSKTYESSAGNRYLFLDEDAADRAISLGTGNLARELNQVEFQQAGGLVYPPATAGEIASASSDINTIGKVERKAIWDTTNNRKLTSAGSNATSGWRDYTGSVVVTPS